MLESEGERVVPYGMEGKDRFQVTCYWTYNELRSATTEGLTIAVFLVIFMCFYETLVVRTTTLKKFADWEAEVEMHDPNVIGFAKNEHKRGGRRGSRRKRVGCDWWEK